MLVPPSALEYSDIPRSRPIAVVTDRLAEGHRGRGAGKAMMKFLSGFAVRTGCSRFDWTGETSNPGGLEFYRALGVEPLREKLYFRLSGEDLQRFAAR